MRTKKVAVNYIAKINDYEAQFDSMSDMLQCVQSYRETHNEIHDLSMFKVKIYSLI